MTIRDIAIAIGFNVDDKSLKKAEKEYDVFRIKQDREYVSEFDREVEKYLKG